MVTNLFIRMPSCLSFKGRNYFEGGIRRYESAPIGAAGVAMTAMDSLPPPPNAAPIVSVRTFFPETWLFDLFETK